MDQIPSPTVLSTDEMGRVAPPIMTSVGQGAINNPADVFVIQSLLNERLPKPHTPVPITGEADPGFVLAIEAYQAVVMGMNPPTGQVAPGSPTYYSLAARPLVNAPPPPTVRYGHVGIVPPDVLQAATASQTRWRVPTSITLAQWAVESAWGASMPPDSNNPFGIKAVGSQPAVESNTREVVNGADQFIRAKFRRFDNLAEAFDHHGRLLATSPVYTASMRFTHDPEAFADSLTGVYATDPKYGYILKWVINNYGFRRYDQPAAAP
ncbi:glycoside hydrolase family 73 protein [Pararoseomonas indoligenes]|uniref:Glucosaminidase domain-containing protein n=1 Tax=Roseomonas indoligenes TaxID=2820811 RepID=A0A940S4A2_9PROT|nr:glucosaminidase domain-containing protein [Pararoseomonas indoligenes]MBP0491774.1 glucosaminidase domain-containing protein [Pararoseomonas indoligenes]